MTTLRVVDPAAIPADPSGTCPWQAAITAALSDGAVRGVILYEVASGTSGRHPINAGRATIRGLCIETIDDLDTRE